jgi:hypothetical protein
MKKNVMLNPSISIQKWTVPSRSDRNLPVTLGHQK